MKTNNTPVDVVAFELGQIVYHKIKPDVQGMVTGILFRSTGPMYYVTWSPDRKEEIHWDCELTTEKSFVAPQS